MGVDPPAGGACAPDSNGEGNVGDLLAGLSGSVPQDQVLPRGARLTKISSGAQGRDNVVLEVRDLLVHRGARAVIGAEVNGTVKGLSFTLRAGELAVLQAPNGWGKTTLMEALAGVIPVSSGEVVISGDTVTSEYPWIIHRKGVSLVNSRPMLFPNLRVKDGLRLAGVGKTPIAIQGLIKRRISSLSGGEKQRVALEYGIGAGGTTVHLLDEPFSALDLAATRQMLNVIWEKTAESAVLIAIPNLVTNGKETLQKEKV
jgi:ABC-type multidrug transport system ATPase subunit